MAAKAGPGADALPADGRAGAVDGDLEEGGAHVKGVADGEPCRPEAVGGPCEAVAGGICDAAVGGPSVAAVGGEKAGGQVGGSGARAALALKVPE